MKRNWITAIAMVLPVLLASGVAIGALPEKPIEVATDYRVYLKGTPITVIIRNIGNETLYGMPNCVVYDRDGELVQSFVFIAIVWVLKPGETMTVVWDQTDLGGNQVSAGAYCIRAGFAEYTKTVKVEIHGLDIGPDTDGDMVEIALINTGTR